METSFSRLSLKGYPNHRPKPIWVSIDTQTSLAAGHFPQLCQHAGIGVTASPGQVHWLLGVVERKIQIIKQVMVEIKVDLPTTSPSVVFGLAVTTHNARDTVKGFSPNQWAYGAKIYESSGVLEHNSAISAFGGHSFFELEKTVLKLNRFTLKRKRSNTYTVGDF